MWLKFFMGYFIVMACFGAVSIYIVKFTSMYGWKVSWAWWWTGCGAAVMEFVVYDIAVSVGNYLLYKVWKRAGKGIYRVRQVKQAREEA